MSTIAPPLMLDHVAYRCKDARETADWVAAENARHDSFFSSSSDWV